MSRKRSNGFTRITYAMDVSRAGRKIGVATVQATDIWHAMGCVERDWARDMGGHITVTSGIELGRERVVLGDPTARLIVFREVDSQAAAAAREP